MKVARTIEEMLAEIHTQRQWVIYGAGWAGRVVCKYLKANHVSVMAFAVTVKGKDQELDGVPVYCLDDILSLRQKADLKIILAVTECHRCSMEEELKKRQVTSCIELQDRLFYQITMENRKLDAEKAEAGKRKGESDETVGYLSPGYLDTNYAEQRLVIGRIEGAAYEAIPKETANITFIDTECTINLERCRQLSEACYCPERYVPEVGLIHTFNMVCRTDRPWCVSFETSVPRISPETESEEAYYLQLVEYMKQPNCRALYALSRNAYEIQKNILSAHIPPDDVKLLMGKTKILHPPQRELVTEEEFERKHGRRYERIQENGKCRGEGKKIRFIFVGGAFFLKGGREIIEVLSEFEGKYDFALTLVSSLQYDDYLTRTSYEEMVKYRNIIQKKDWIDYYKSLPNEAVLEKCREASVGLLPSIADTYGYVVLEMQAAGCPVITTNVRAFPETNNEDCGWVCHLPVNEFGFCTERDTKAWSGVLRQELKRCFKDIFEHPEKIRKKGRLALERIRAMHDPYEYQRELRRNLFYKAGIQQ